MGVGCHAEHRQRVLTMPHSTHLPVIALRFPDSMFSAKGTIWLFLTEVVKRKGVSLRLRVEERVCGPASFSLCRFCLRESTTRTMSPYSCLSLAPVAARAWTLEAPKRIK